ncbi:hypothetical protein PVAND_016717 [Polypedilum vanderplanki]|uniref:Uncharacterized protein n=1 Tax=Polypedilum vanderplanki TaxID=319348 RepID=A0A9J6BGT4_POLVA|nr:hypothetical protein PVAND_016717 [Polypedilum vanderplanki]
MGQPSGNQGMQQPQMGNQGMQQPQMGGQGMQQPQMGGQQQQQQQGGQGQQQNQQQGGGQAHNQQEMSAEEKAVHACVNTIKTTLTHPYACCQFPVMSIKGTKAATCPNDCQGSSDQACIPKCIVKNLYLFDENMKMQVKGWVEFFNGGLEEQNIPKGNWPEIIEASVKKCVDALALPENRIITEHTELLMNYPFYCMSRANFIACPTLTDSEICKKTQQFFADPQSCYAKYGMFIAGPMFWTMPRQQQK